jgi:hypothetical protein
VNSHFGSWSPDGFPNLQKEIAGVKTHQFKEFFIWLESYWNVDVCNELTWPIWTFKTQVMAKRDSQFDSRPLKVRNRFDFLAFKWRATYRWKALNKGSKFSLDLIAIGLVNAKLWAPQVTGIPIVGIPGLALGSLGTKCHLDVGLMERHKVYYKGEGGGFPQV